MAETLSVSELFYSIQGESYYAGLPCFFVRLAGCNLRCSYCDARYTYEEPGTSMTISQIIDRIGEYPGSPVEITGGEPLLQEGIYPLMEILLKAGRTVLLETNGSLPLDQVPARVVKIMDMKCPDSGMCDKMDYSNLDLLRQHDEVKFVISSQRDYDWAKSLADKHNLFNKVRLSFSPAAGRLTAKELAEWILADRLNIRLQLQLHTILWPDKTRGF
jgi:7-carboxy-7-deazaguanine synthase